MILVTGATGNFGKLAIEFLIKKGTDVKNIAALVRDESKAADLKAKGIILKKGDYDDSSLLAEAFEGVDKLLFVSSSDIAARTKQHENVINAAKEAGVKHILYTSFERKNETGTSPIAFVEEAHLATEKWLKASGIAYTIFRNNLYMDFIPLFIGDKVLETGIYWPSGDGKSAVVAREDMAEAVVNVLLGEGHENKDYYISHTQNVSYQDVADELSRITGKKISYTSPTVDEYKSTLEKHGVPAEYVHMFSAFAEAIKQGEFETDKSDLESLLKRKPVSLPEYLQQVYGSK